MASFSTFNSILFSNAYSIHLSNVHKVLSVGWASIIIEIDNNNIGIVLLLNIDFIIIFHF